MTSPRFLSQRLLGFLIFAAAPGAFGAATDWLIDPSPYRAEIREDAATGDIILENGLVRRVIRTHDGCATTGYDQLTADRALIRSVRPEAVVTLDGAEIAVGGLTAPPVGNYLDAATLAKAHAAPGAYVFDRAEKGATAARFAWKKRPEWMPRDMPWPPPGRSLALRFKPPGTRAASPGPSLFEDECAGILDAGWKISATKTHARASYANEGKVGEIMAPPDTAVFAERAIPSGAKEFEIRADVGDDEISNSWGPGLALLAGGKPVASLVMRPQSRQFEYYGSDGIQHVAGTFDRDKPATLRIRIEKNSAVFETALTGGAFVKLGEAKLVAHPDALRVGRIGRGGAGVDYPGVKADPAALPPRVHISQVVVRGEPRSVETASELPEVVVHYEIYDGIPLISKWLTVENRTKKNVRLNRVNVESLAVVEAQSRVGGRKGEWDHPYPYMHVESDYTCGGDASLESAERAVFWKRDPQYKTQVNYSLATPCLLECAPERGPDTDIAPGATFESFRIFELAYDSLDLERNSLARRRLYRTVAPWTTENPILMHVKGSDDASIRTAVDQCAEVGFQMVVMTFGSGFDFESRDPAYAARYKKLSDYARSKGVALGAYSLLASRGAATKADNTRGAPTAFGVMPCLGAKWGEAYLKQIRDMCVNAGLEVFENDGSYPGDECTATDHPGHRGIDDSRWVQWKAMTGLYQWCLANGVYTNVPDWYPLSGCTKMYMGYRETNWSLPRERQEIIERQNIFDGTRDKTASMGWMFVPLTQYHGGGAAATIEPLKDHLPHYGLRMANLFGAGVQACYRGPRLFDSPETKALVKKWVGFYKRHRLVLDSDIIHLRRADGRDLDYLLHANPAGPEKGLLMVYNPLETPVTKTLRIPLYYTGLSSRATVAENDGPRRPVALDADRIAELPVTIPAKGASWYVFE